MKLFAIIFTAFLASSSMTQAQFEITIPRDFLTQLQFDVSDNGLAGYIVRVIFTQAVEKELTTQLVLTLYQVDEITLEQMEEIVQALNLAYSTFFSINNLSYCLELFGIQFTTLVNNVLNEGTGLGVVGESRISSLNALGIDGEVFVSHLGAGRNQELWATFIQGTFTQATMESAATVAGVSLEDLWSHVRDFFLISLRANEIAEFVQLVRNQNIDETKAVLIWQTIPITTAFARSIPEFNVIVAELETRINSQSALGVLTAVQEVIINRASWEVFQNEFDFLNINALTVETRTSISIGSANDTIYQNLVLLRHSEIFPFENLTTIEVSNMDTNLTNCSLVIFVNNEILTPFVPWAYYDHEQDRYLLERTVADNVQVGSALVCENILYGLARGIVGDYIVVDGFTTYSGAEKLVTFSGICCLVMIAVKQLLF